MKFETERLILRAWEISDANSLYEYAKNPRVGPSAGWSPHKNIDESLFVIKNVFNTPQYYAICEKENLIAIGAIEIKIHTDKTQGDYECELGFWLGEPFWGKGYMIEAARTIIQYAFEELHMTTIWCAYYEGNRQSKRVQEKLDFIYHHTCQSEVPLLNETRTSHVSKLTKERYKNMTSRK